MLLRVAPCTETAWKWKWRAAQAVRLEWWEKYQPLPFPFGFLTNHWQRNNGPPRGHFCTERAQRGHSAHY